MKKILIVVAIFLAVAGLSFMAGRYASRIHVMTAATSLQANQLRVSLTMLREGNQNETITYLEERLDSRIWFLDQQMQEPKLWRILFIPKNIREQAENSLSLFVDYRKNVGTNYTGMHISEIPPNATPEESFQIRRASRNKNIINKRIKGLLEEN